MDMNIEGRAKWITYTLAMIVVLAGAGGCGESEGYAVPESLCGKKVAPQLLRPLLPAGERIDVRQGLEDDWSETCRVSVDKELVLYIEDARAPGAIDATTYAWQPLRQLKNLHKADIGDDGMLANNGAYVVNRCTYRGKKSSYVLEIHVFGSLVKSSDSLRAKIQRFAKSYLPVGSEAMGCGK
ncbi:hypothetical protein AB0I49_15715 [Streptomyces sp. NPDC050617]|uniref:hypothetical protein n=1 Tax=Streptomyces sp. NPDC050617 TaxID=3154628 RepID=UPI003420F715